VANIERLLTEKQAAEMLGVHHTTLATWRCKRRYTLPFVKLGTGRAVRYRLRDVEAFIAAGLTDQTTPLKPAGPTQEVA
jgi:predicted DNA-binding transcriptional regulator AlpA